ncbi:MAG TPA: hypothetical protein PKD54_16020, partial [Pirellulaceae bacterium]|nr:hypothetical protein [Pirellulaceae bacterium]
MLRLLFVAVLLLINGGVDAQQLTSGSGGRAQKDEVLAAIPLQQLNPAVQNRVVDILQKASLYRHLPKTAIQIDPDYMTFLCCYPEIIIEIWRLMEVTHMSAARTAPFTLSCSDGEGTESTVDLIYATDRMQIYVGEGTYEGPLLRRKIRGDCVIVIRT